MGGARAARRLVVVALSSIEMFEHGSRELAHTRVLVVDDEPDQRETLDAFFSTFGISVIDADSGESAFGRFVEERPDIIVSDVWMPNGNGLELIRRIRRLPPTQGGLTPAISVSGGATAKQSLEAGFHYHFVKPVDPLVLLDAVRDFVRAGRARRAQWTLERRGGDVVLRWDGHATAEDMRGMVAGLTALLAESGERLRVVNDMRRLTGFDPSVGAVAQTAAWDARHNIGGVLVVGGSTLAKLVSRSCCLILGIACELADDYS